MYEETIAAEAEHPKRDTHVGRQLSEMEEGLDRLQKSASILSQQLGSVLRDDEQTPVDKMATIDDRIVPLADRYRDHVRRVQRIGEQLDDLSRRLEL